MHTWDDSLSDAQISRAFTGALNVAHAGDGLPPECAALDRTVLEPRQPLAQALHDGTQTPTSRQSRPAGSRRSRRDAPAQKPSRTEPTTGARHLLTARTGLDTSTPAGERAGRRERPGNRDEARFLRPEDPITATVQRIGSAVVLAVGGELDMASTPAFKSAISEALIGRPQAVVIDLSDVGFLGSAGVSTLVQACEKIGKHAQFAVVTGGARNGRTIEMLNLTDLLSVYDGLDDALKSFVTS